MQGPRLYATRAAAIFAAAATIGIMPSGALVAQTASPRAEPIQFASLSTLPIRPTDNRVDRDSYPAWHGRAVSPANGSVTLTLERIGEPQSVFDPLWPVMVRWEYDARDPSKSFTARLFGTGDSDWAMTLYGVVTSGYALGQEVEVKVHGGAHGNAVVSFWPQSSAP
ncbi:MAG TPA: hypothetical protein VIC55_01205 [Gemmatimonadaceae bacterium]|jgi:hypothetical protein